jgi:hypothetical protein
MTDIAIATRGPAVPLSAAIMGAVLVPTARADDHGRPALNSLRRSSWQAASGQPHITALATIC